MRMARWRFIECSIRASIVSESIDRDSSGEVPTERAFHTSEACVGIHLIGNLNWLINCPRASDFSPVTTGQLAAGN